jgi:hypothetical protein
MDWVGFGFDGPLHGFGPNLAPGIFNIIDGFIYAACKQGNRKHSRNRH